MSLLITFSAIALIIKSALFLVAREKLFIENKLLAAFLVTLFMLNLAEFLSFSMLYLEITSTSLLVLKCFYVAAVFSASAFMSLSVSLGTQNKPLVTGLFILAGMFSIAILSGDSIIAGIQLISYSSTRIEGEFYWMLRLFLLGCLFGSLLALAYFGMRGKHRLVRQRSTVMLLGAAPLILSSLAVLGLMLMGYQVNATITLSISSTILMIVLIFTEARYQLFRFLSYVPYTHEYRLRNQASILVDRAIERLFRADSGVELKDIRSEFETALIKLALESTGGDKTRAAKILGIGKATLHRKIEGMNL